VDQESGRLVALGILLGGLSWGASYLVYRDDKKQLERVIGAMIWAALILALLGFGGLTAVTCPNC
jgi:Na+-driven multidrug efflux pump